MRETGGGNRIDDQLDGQYLKPANTPIDIMSNLRVIPPWTESKGHPVGAYENAYAPRSTSIHKNINIKGI